jgi:NADH:ubiquinone oxidoreductase subunit 5 (subunit L)/multisubunit Na+/H+ antiporter MnhA subunit
MKLVLTIGSIVLSLMTLFLGFVFVKSLRYPYNSEGRYFDEASATVHHEQSEPVYGLLFTCCTIVTIVTLYKTRKAFYK